MLIGLMAALSGKAFQKFLEYAAPHVPLLKVGQFLSNNLLNIATMLHCLSFHVQFYFILFEYMKVY